jgi:hypothetical protein
MQLFGVRARQSRQRHAPQQLTVAVTQKAMTKVQPQSDKMVIALHNSQALRIHCVQRLRYAHLDHVVTQTTDCATHA